jgi:hypothetical protein
MNANQRFCLNENRHITDRLNPSVDFSWPEELADDELHLREHILWRRLADLVNALIINTNPVEKLPNGEEVSTAMRGSALRFLGTVQHDRSVTIEYG